METEPGKRINIRYKCRLDDGRVYLVGEHNTFEFVVGTGRVPPTLEQGLMGMAQGDHRVIRVPGAEANLFPFPLGSHFAFSTGRAPGVAYDFGPGAGGDVSLSLPGRTRDYREPLPAGQDVFFEVEMLAVEER
ncbi:FKBP-type peptidyl-prolyl cis-trans isomerase [Geomonas azotofigens]|uniref:FKBP-type peptidyl-prolyl cis-trans isomerase n=1 Tax=Geomonas azotofigens TaxID=2843196 RepID=UPI001C117FB8|nr:FKBP-type peptidyl-prolyl cis-trans isomerase [Geomonas azotofigens]MBU5612222.1 FKBP-type peptidyl-prolyl cis-trans isomerase [Geomonas azotofigens]